MYSRVLKPPARPQWAVIATPKDDEDDDEGKDELGAVVPLVSLFDEWREPLCSPDVEWEPFHCTREFFFDSRPSPKESEHQRNAQIKELHSAVVAFNGSDNWFEHFGNNKGEWKSPIPVQNLPTADKAIKLKQGVNVLPVGLQWVNFAALMKSTGNVFEVRCNSDTIQERLGGPALRSDTTHDAILLKVCVRSIKKHDKTPAPFTAAVTVSKFTKTQGSGGGLQQHTVELDKSNHGIYHLPLVSGLRAEDKVPYRASTDMADPTPMGSIVTSEASVIYGMAKNTWNAWSPRVCVINAPGILEECNTMHGIPEVAAKLVYVIAAPPDGTVMITPPRSDSKKPWLPMLQWIVLTFHRHFQASLKTWADEAEHSDSDTTLDGLHALFGAGNFSSDSVVQTLPADADDPTPSSSSSSPSSTSPSGVRSSNAPRRYFVITKKALVEVLDGITAKGNRDGALVNMRRGGVRFRAAMSKDDIGVFHSNIVSRAGKDLTDPIRNPDLKLFTEIEYHLIPFQVKQDLPVATEDEQKLSTLMGQGSFCMPRTESKEPSSSSSGGSGSSSSTGGTPKSMSVQPAVKKSPAKASRRDLADVAYYASI